MSTSTTRRRKQGCEAATAPAAAAPSLTSAQRAALHHVYQIILSFAPPAIEADAHCIPLQARTAPVATRGDV